MAQLSGFGKQVKKKLIDIDCDQNWLIDQVKERTGLFFDSSYLRRILTGERTSQKIISAICDILDLKFNQQPPAERPGA